MQVFLLPDNTVWVKKCEYDRGDFGRLEVTSFFKTLEEYEKLTGESADNLKQISIFQIN